MTRLLPVAAVAALAVVLAGCGTIVPARKSARPRQPNLKVISYNVLYGFNHHKAVDAGAAWIAAEEPDIVALQELNGFTQATLAELAARWGHGNAVILKEQGFPVGLTSRDPIEVVEKRLEGMHHGYLHCRTAGYEVFVVHLHPGDFRFRQREAEVLSPQIEALVDSGAQVIVLGDFNSVSASDRAWLETKTDLLERRLEGSNLDEGRFDYSVMERFLGSGLVDSCDEMLINNDEVRTSFPSRILDHVRTPEEQAQFRERIDFILLAEGLLPKLVKVRVAHDEVLNTISDHYPVVVELRR